MPVFDTEPLLIFYLDEEGADVVEKELKKVKAGKNRGLLNVVNMTEFYYVIYRRDPSAAEREVKDLKSWGVETVPIGDDEIWREAGRIKGEHAVPLGDAFSSATANVKGEKLLVGEDEDFKGIDVKLIRCATSE
ncbi:hypothetical protein AKJ57_01790 [candidate division MSBL1 archaeon SCGC-AAA259A05]|uniref:PIN domain-containing protein n=1 Tax=candidate division MSBL1 archaeon SCGC-AAA259A05 TaxID=1698259 RepID=A0A133UAQ3_9EURY|nr:hypothetical protein AKJ57_01790 [candidate division MSBL1 archaeon SCGC-AAA259A05]